MSVLSGETYTYSINEKLGKEWWSGRPLSLPKKRTVLQLSYAQLCSGAYLIKQ